MNFISVIVPTFNEVKNITELLLRLRASLRKLHVPYEIIFIDDNSTDRTFEVLSQEKSTDTTVFRKKGKSGKAYSLIEGFARARGDIIIMLDGDLQYPPEAIITGLNKFSEFDVVVADRRQYGGSLLRRILSNGFRTVFGKLAFKLNYDIQSGLKIFRRSVWETVSFNPKSAWTFDLEFLHRARNAGFRIGAFQIDFLPRKAGVSKLSFVNQTLEIGLNSIIVRLRRVDPFVIPPSDRTSMIGSGLRHKDKRYITHTTLPLHLSALKTLHTNQAIGVALILAVTGFLLFFYPLGTAQVIIGILSLIYFIDVFFNLFIVMRSAQNVSEVKFDISELNTIDENTLPTYSILCPFYKESAVLPQFIGAISKLSWPKNKLDVLLLLEEDDTDTIRKVETMDLPSFVRAVVVPNSIPKTKPKACNFGLGLARGEYIVVYDAEDIPDPYQLKKAYLAFNKLPRNVVCLQAKLNYYNPEQNILTRFFTAEYALWFDITLTGLQEIKTAIPLGGTSNHFRTKDLQNLQGWDPFNVTEDADLGVRLFKKGYQTVIIDSTTLEEANSEFINWLRQRSRWIKGYMQTYLVHMRDPLSFVKRHGIHSFLFQLTVGGKLAFIFINPFLWVATFAYFFLYSIFGSTIESVYPTAVFYMAIIPFIFGNFLFLYYYMIGCAKRQEWWLIKYVYLIPFYWLMISIAGFIALKQLIVNPHYWEKTVHGLHLGRKPIAKQVKTGVIFPGLFPGRLVAGGLLVASSLLANVLNLFFNIYLGRVLEFSVLGLIGLIGSFSYLSTVPFNALATTVNYRSSLLDGKYGHSTALSFWSFIRHRVLFVGIAISIIWVILSPFIASYFQVDTVVPFIIFMPIWLIGFAASVDKGYLFGRFMFASLAIIAIVEPIFKLLFAFLFISLGKPEYVVSSIPLSIVGAFIAGWILVLVSKSNSKISEPLSNKAHSFPIKFLVVSALSGLGTMSFLTIDVILAKHYLPPDLAGKYVLLSLSGKIIFFLGSLSTQFTVSLISRIEAQKKESLKTFYTLLFSTILLSLSGYIAFLIFGNQITHILFREKAKDIVSFLPVFGLGVFCFTISRVFVSYYLTKKVFSLPILSFLIVLFQIYLIYQNHSGIESFVLATAVCGVVTLAISIVMHLGIRYVERFEHTLVDLFALFSPLNLNLDNRKLRILIFNWRDTKHIWAGGAEAYIHEIAKRWVKSGVEVVLFCGNDYRHGKYEDVEGVRVIRRGGHYTVYVFAFLYYIIKLRNKFDVVVDCENGIPFFTPFYVRKPVFLLIHHMHQEVFAEHLRFPFSRIAMLLEGRLMPLAYKGNQIITVSESSKKQIAALKIANVSDVHIVNPGINDEHLARSEKYHQPTFLYLGRLKSYKNIDIAIEAFAIVLKANPTARLFIVGSGERAGALRKLAEKLHIDASVYFFGFVTEKTKAELLAKSWAVLHPSMMEGWAISVIEANASGTPVIASNANGLKDSIINGSTGILIDVGDTEKMARAMVDIIIDKNYRNILSKQAYLWSKNFAWEKSADQFYRIIIEAISESYEKLRTQELALTNK